MKHCKASVNVLFVLLFILSYLLGSAQSTYSVTPSGAGAKNGSSWGNASDDLQDMINAASSGDQIWVAQRIYMPTVKMDFDNSVTAEARETIFHIHKNVAIYGGFT